MPKIQCSRPSRCYWCDAPSTLLCDGPGKTPGKTCDAPLCPRHAVHVDADRDLCPDCHQGEPAVAVERLVFGKHDATGMKLPVAQKPERRDPDGAR